MASSKIVTTDLHEPVVEALNTINNVDIVVDSIKTTVEGNSTKLTSVDSKLTMIDGNIGTINTNVSSIKTAIENMNENSGTDVLYRSDEYLHTIEESKTIVSQGSSGNSTTNTLIGSFTADMDFEILKITVGGVYGTYAQQTTYVEVKTSSGTSVGTKEIKGVNATNLTVEISNVTSGTVYNIYIRHNYDSSRWWNYGSISAYYKSTPQKILSSEKYPANHAKDVIINSTDSSSVLSYMPRLDRCEFDYIVNGVAPVLYTHNNIQFVREIPAKCIMRIKY